MKYLGPLFALCFTAACGGTSVPIAVSTSGGGTAPAASTGGSGPSGGVGDVTFTALINDVRSDFGVGDLAYNGLLDQAAVAHANDMHTNGFFAHEGSDGSQVWDRVTATGYNWSTVGENIARGYQTEESVLAGWEGSPGHHANNINPNFEEFGLGIVGEGSQRHWVLVFAAPR